MRGSRAAMLALCGVSAVFMVLASVQPALGSVITVTGPQDTQCATIIQGGPGYEAGHWNYGGATFANVMPEDETLENMLLRFDLPSLDSPDDLLSATLTLVRNDWLSNEGILRLYRLTESWEEGTTGAALDGACDWYDRYHGTAAWSVPGAVGGASSLSVPTATYTVSGEYVIQMDVTEDVRYWYQNGVDASNFGWVMTCEDSNGQYRYGIRFYSDDYSSAGARPALALEIVPLPGALALALLGAGTVIARRKRTAL